MALEGSLCFRVNEVCILVVCLRMKRGGDEARTVIDVSLGCQVLDMYVDSVNRLHGTHLIAIV